jgi:hypothetical protein
MAVKVELPHSGEAGDRLDGVRPVYVVVGVSEAVEAFHRGRAAVTIGTAEKVQNLRNPHQSFGAPIPAPLHR